MKKIIFILFILVIYTRSYTDSTKNQLHLVIKAGEYFQSTGKIGPKKLNTTPQIAIWVESEDGSQRQTLWMTKKFAKQLWAGQSYDTSKVFRGYTFPRWISRFPEQVPTSEKPLPDSVTGASPYSDLELDLLLPGAGKWKIFLEANNAFDENENYPNGQLKDGQPSVVYSGWVDSSRKGKTVLTLTGWVDSQGNIQQDVSKLTTALHIFKTIETTLK